MSRNRARGFTLLELLVVVAIIGIIAAIATVAYLSALDRARQKRTMADMKAIAASWEARASEMRSYGVAGYNFPTDSVQYEDLFSALVPTYTRIVPRVDGWNRNLEFGIGPGPKNYAIRSTGRDGSAEGTSYTPGETNDLDCDIVFANGGFVTYPGSTQGQ
jgi:type II secretion system protein G